MDLNKYKKIADNIGGEIGKLISDMIKEFEAELQDKQIPQLLGNKEVAEEIGVSPKNMTHTRKTKFFPNPITYIGKRPFWTFESINEYKRNIELWRLQQSKSDDYTPPRDG